MALGTASAPSAALLALNTAITVDNAEHLTKLELLDMELFDDAVTAHSAHAEAISARAVAGARGLVALARTVSSTSA